ncbi:MAG: glycosyl transferase family 1 [Chloroflexi bacterium]|nr:glycosyl transferase family 1 [Chloroflexota bacterium]|tara:strand:- start:6709 stop:7917 length:1209 start_codon:yes stop_codon:yes gene_type:complete
MLRVAFVSVHGCPNAKLGSKEAGGMNVYVRKVAVELGKLGMQVDIYTRYHGDSDNSVEYLADKVRIIHINAGHPHLAKNQIYDHLEEFTRNTIAYARSENIEYDLVQSHYWLSGRVGQLLSESWDIPHVTTFHTLADAKVRSRSGEHEPEVRFESENNIIKSADLVVAFTDHERQLMARYHNVDPLKVEVIPCGVDTDLFNPIDRNVAKEKLGITASRVALYVGRIEPLKGLEILIRAVTQIHSDEGLSLIIVGGDPDADEEIIRLKQIILALRMESSISFIGAVDQQELPLYYNASDVLVIPSYYESFGLVALEAMACGIPVIASRVGGLPTTVKDSKTGYLVPWRCPDPFADKLQIILNNQSIHDAMSRSAIELSLQMKWSKVAEDLAEAYATLIGRPSD